MSELTQIFSIFSLPKKISSLVTTVKGLLTSGPLQAIADTDTAFNVFLADVKIDSAELMTDAEKFNWEDIGEWLGDFKKLCTDATTIGLQVVSLYEGLAVDPAVAGSLGVILTIISDVSSLLSTIGVKIPTPALSPAATKAVTTTVEPVVEAPPVVEETSVERDITADPSSLGAPGGALI